MGNFGKGLSGAMGGATTGMTVGGPMGAAVGGALGMIGGLLDNSEEKAYENQLKLLQAQTAENMKLADQGQKHNKELWDYTSYESQVAHMKAAGLNPAMLYGMGGGGGQSASGAQPSGAGLPQDRSVEMGLQAQALQSEIALNMANAKKANADAEATSGYKQNEAMQGIEESKARINRMGYENRLTSEMTDYYKELELYTQSQTDVNNMLMLEIPQRAGYLMAQARKAGKEADILEKTETDLVEGAWLANQEVISKIGLNKEQANYYKQTVSQGWKRLEQEWNEITLDWKKGVRERNLQRELFQNKCVQQMRMIAAELDIHKYDGDVKKQLAIINGITGMINTAAMAKMGGAGAKGYQREVVKEIVDDAGEIVRREITNETKK